MTKGKKGLVGQSEKFLESAKNLNREAGGEQDQVEAEAPRKGVSEQLREAAENLRHAEYAKTTLVPMIDSFVASHVNGQIATEPEIRQFYTDVLTNLVKEGYISAEEAKKFQEPSKVVIKEETEVERTGFMGKIMGGKQKVQTERTIDGPSGFDEAVKGTIKTINDHGAMQLKLDMTEKLMFGVGKLCKSLGLESMSKFCMQQIKPENLEKITTREKVLASAIDAVSAIGSKGDQPKPGTKVEALVAKRAENRSGGMGGRD
jgi:polyhydroxyalkanoate synthesis regulator phasin